MFGAINSFTVLEVRREENFCNREKFVRVLFSLNGEQYDVVTTVKDDISVRSDVARAIAEQIVTQIAKDIFRRWRPL